MTNILGNLYTRQKDYHVYTTDNIGLNELGLGSYSRSSVENMFKTFGRPTTTTVNPNQSQATTTPPPKQGSPEINEISLYFGDQVSTTSKKLVGDEGLVHPPQIFAYNKKTLKYDLHSGAAIFQYEKEDNTIVSVANNIKEFTDKYNDCIINKSAPSRDDILKVAQKINTSLSGCITFRISYKALTCDQQALIKLRLLNKDNSNDSRIIASKGSPIIAGVPTRISGKKYSHKGTDQSSIGVYQNPFQEDINNPSNTVAGELDIRFNKTIGKWQAGTHQILCRLTTDVDSANTPILTEIGGDNTSFYSTESENWIGQFSIGKMIPLSMENGNPYMYGPNFIGCPSGSTSRIEELMAVNRSNRTFKKGDIVLASYIEGEWIIQGFDKPEIITKKTNVGKWQFQKFIVNSDSFFRDNRFKYNNTPTSSLDFDYTKETASRDSQIIYPHVYEDKSRMLFYTDTTNVFHSQLEPEEKNKLLKINLYLDMPPASAELKQFPPLSQYDFILSKDYYQSSIFDQVSSSIGGNNMYGNVISRTNIYHSPFGNASEDGLIYQKNLPNFWGPVFRDGYTSESVRHLIGKHGSVAIPNNSNSNLWFANSTTLAFNTSTDITITSGIFSNSGDVNFLQLPAEIGTNASLESKHGLPIERMNIEIGSDKNMSHLTNFFIHNKERFSHIMNNTSGDIFGLKPVSPNIIQFSPLQFQLATSLTNITPGLGYDILKTEIESAKGTEIFKTDRKNDFIFDSILLPKNFITRNTQKESGLKLEKFEIIENNEKKLVCLFYIPFGTFVKFPRAASSPLGGPGIIPLGNIAPIIFEKSNLIGIIAAKNKIKSATKSINFNIRQYFGLPPKLTIAGGQGPQVTILGAFLSWTNQSNPIMQNSQPQWGDRDRQDAINSFGTTAMHVRVFDEWPDKDTIYDGRYFSILHFNPSTTILGLSEEEKEALQKKYGYPAKSFRRNPNGVLQFQYYQNIYHDLVETDVDFREPTGGSGLHPSEKSMMVGSIISSGSMLSDASVWRINPIRRGALLTGGGFKYFKKVIGLDAIELLEKSAEEIEMLRKAGSQDISKEQRGSGYLVGDIINFPNQASIRVESLLSAGGPAGQIGSWSIVDSGIGFVPSDFRTSVSGVRNTSGGTGSGAQFVARRGRVYHRYYHDEGPSERCPITRLTSPSNQGKEEMTRDVITSINLDGGNGKYDAFYFMHNDVLHTQLFEGAFRGGFAQHVTLEIT